MILTLLIWGIWAITVIWLAALIYNVISIKNAPRLPQITKRGILQTSSDALPQHASKASLPLVSILVPARNEAGRILAQSIRSMLAQDYPDFEVIVVDDRSTDSTFEILKSISRADSRLKVISGEPLPPGWVGKPWALYQAKRASKGEWVLATDADVVFHQTVLSQAMALAVREDYAAVTLAPNVSSDSFWARLVMPVAGWLIMLLYPTWRVNDPRSEVALGVGGFFLMRRDAHDAIGGYESIRNDVTDDLNTARLLKRAGYRLYLAAAPALLWTPMYSSLAELFEGFGKNVFVGAGESAVRALLGALLNFALTVAPLITGAVASAMCLLSSSNLFPLALAGLAGYLSMVLSFIPVYKETQTPMGYAFLSFLAHLLMIAILLRSTWRIATGKGVVWKSRSLYERAKNESGAGSSLDSEERRIF